MAIQLNIDKLLNECRFKASPSSGPGGQHVNKVSTRIELRFNIENSDVLSQEEKFILFEKLKKNLSASGDIIVVSQEERSQYKNKERAKLKLINLLEDALKPEIPRKPTKPSKASKEKRLVRKRITSIKKEQRKPPEIA